MILNISKKDKKNLKMIYGIIIMLLTSSLLATPINAQDTIDTLKKDTILIDEIKKDTIKMVQDWEDIRMEQHAINKEMDDKLEVLKKNA